MAGKNKKAQEELVGFAIIMVIVVVIILFFLVFALRGNSSQNDQSYQVKDFILSSMQYTTTCEGYTGNYSAEDLVFQCARDASCDDGRSACAVLNSTMKGMLDAAWNVQNGSAVKGYEMKILSNGKNLASFDKGTQTKSYQGDLETPARGAYSAQVSLKVYY